MIALLRGSGIHARFVQGVAELPATEAANWLGVNTAASERLDAAPDILASGGVPTTQVRANGEIVKVRFDHVWAEAYVPGDGYRGVDEGVGGKTWLSLDPSIKENEFTEPAADFQALLEPALLEWAQNFADGSQTVGDDGIVAPPSAEMAASTEALVDDVEGILREHGIDEGSTLDQIIGGSRIKAVRQTYLPASAPFRERAVVAELRTLPSSLNASVSVAVSGSDPLSLPSYDPDEPTAAGFTYTARTADLADKRVTIGYVPATEDDAEIIDAYHGMLNAPTYAAALIPVLRVDGKVVARGHRAVSTGYTQNLKITYRMPGFSSDVVENPVYVGSLSAVALSVGSTSTAQLNARAERLGQLSETTPSNLLTDARGGEVLSMLGSYYFARNNFFDEIAAQASGIDRTRLLSGGIVASATSVSYIAGFPIFARFSGFQIDVDEDVQSVVSKTGDERVSAAYLRAAGMNASSSEGAIFSEALGGTGVSTGEVMRDAMARGAAILVIDKSNVDRLDELTDVSADVKQEISRAINERNATVLIPDSETTIDGWTGVGYIIDEGSTISYRISGGLNGGALGMSLSEAAARVGDLVEDGGKKLLDALKAISPDWFEDCNVVRAGTLGGTVVIAAIFFSLVARHIGAPMAILPGLTLPAGLLGAAGMALWAAILVVSVFATMAAIEACLDESAE